jgi:hypothetical protein
VQHSHGAIAKSNGMTKCERAYGQRCEVHSVSAEQVASVAQPEFVQPLRRRACNPRTQFKHIPPLRMQMHRRQRNESHRELVTPSVRWHIATYSRFVS